MICRKEETTLKKQSNGGFSLVEVLVAIMVLSAIVIPVCSSILLSVRVNTKANDILQNRVAVSSAVETLMAQGITHPSDRYDIVIVDGSEQDLFPGVTVETVAEQNEPEPAYYIVTVKDSDGLVTVTTKIRAASTETTAPTDPGGGQ